MCDIAIAALLGLATGCGAPPAPASLLAPVNPAATTRWHPPPAPTAGLKRYQPVEARGDWGAPASPSDRTASGNNQPGMTKPDSKMPGMDMPGMDMSGKGGK